MLVLAAVSAALLPMAACDTPTPAPVTNGDWPQWRGPGSAGIAASEALPVTWSETENVKWKSAVPGVGNSSPVVVADLVYLTSSQPVAESHPPLESKLVMAFAADDGTLLWQTEVARRPAEKLHPRNTAAGPTPLADAGGVFAYFGSILARVDREGELLWVKTVDDRYAKFSRYGAASSPVFSSTGVVIVQDKEYADNGDIGWLATFDRETGDEVWRTEWTETCCSYSTPVVVDRGAGEEIVHAHSGAVRGYDAATGARLWNHEIPALQMVSTPIVEDDVVYVLGGADHKRANVAFRLVGAGAQTSFEPLWSSTRLAPQASSSVLYRDLLFSATLQGVAVAREPSDGSVLWQERMDYRRIQAAVLAGDGKVFMTSQGGAVSVFSATREPELLSVNVIEEGGSTSTPAIGGGCFLVRSPSSLYCFADMGA